MNETCTGVNDVESKKKEESSLASAEGGNLFGCGVLECKECFVEYSDRDVKRFPRLLRCGHSFCSECLEKVLDDSQLVCFVCEEITLVGEKGVKSLGTNLPLLESIQLSNISKSNSSGLADGYFTDEEDDEGWSALYCPERNSDQCEICLVTFDESTHSRDENMSSVHSICRSCLIKIRRHHLDEAEWIMPADPPPVKDCFEINGDITTAVLDATREAVPTEKISPKKCARGALTATAASQFATQTLEKSVTKAVPYIDIPILNGVTKSVTSSVLTEASKKVVFASSGGAAAFCDLGVSTAQDMYRWSNGEKTKGIVTNMKNAAWTGVCAGAGFVVAGPVGAFVGGLLAPKHD